MRVFERAKDFFRAKGLKIHRGGVYEILSDTLENTVAHRNALQYTATHCNTLQHTATHCSALQHSQRIFPRAKGLKMRSNDAASHCNSLQQTATHCNTLLNTQRILSRAKGLKIVLGTLARAVGPVLNTVAIALTCFFVLGIMSVQIMGRQCVAVGCSGLQWVAVGCSGLQFMGIDSQRSAR